MLIETKGIVIKQIRFSDSGVIVKIFTEANGIQSFFVRGSSGKKSKGKAAFFQPLTLLSLSYKHSEKKNLHAIHEVELLYNYKTLNSDMKKQSLMIFINELLYKCLQEESGSKDLFKWVYNSMIWLDMSDTNTANFHLSFMIQLTKFMGFYPTVKTDSEDVVFNFKDGDFTRAIPSHPNYISGDTARYIYLMYLSTYETMSEINIDRRLRNTILETLIAYYNYHIPSLGEFKSIDVLKVVLN